VGTRNNAARSGDVFLLLKVACPYFLMSITYEHTLPTVISVDDKSEGLRA